MNLCHYLFTFLSFKTLWLFFFFYINLQKKEINLSKHCHFSAVFQVFRSLKTALCKEKIEKFYSLIVENQNNLFINQTGPVFQFNSLTHWVIWLQWLPAQFICDYSYTNPWPQKTWTIVHESYGPLLYFMIHLWCFFTCMCAFWIVKAPTAVRCNCIKMIDQYIIHIFAFWVPQRKVKQVCNNMSKQMMTEFPFLCKIFL